MSLEKLSRSSYWLQRTTQLVLTDEVSTPHCLPCPWSSHIWGGYQSAYTTLSSFSGKWAQVLYRSEVLHYKLWQIKSWLAQIFVQWSNNFIHCPKQNHSCQSTAQVMPVANSLDNTVLNSINKLPGSLGKGDWAVWPSPALVPPVTTPRLERVSHHSDLYKALGTALWTTTKRSVTNFAEQTQRVLISSIICYLVTMHHKKTVFKSSFSSRKYFF